MKTLELHDVTVNRGAGSVISGVNLTVREGEITALVGPNGAGKTSLLESISGVIPTTKGKITLGEASIEKLSRIKRAGLGLVHVEQGRAIFPGLTVMENLRLTAKNTAELDAALAIFPELEKRRNSVTGLLSGGEQQMVVLARAFAAKPSFMLIDEMSLGLAPVVFLRLLPIIQRFAEEGVGVLLVEQFTHLALGVASDALVASNGHITFRGSAQQLVDQPELLRAAYMGQNYTDQNHTGQDAGK